MVIETDVTNALVFDALFITHHYDDTEYGAFLESYCDNILKVYFIGDHFPTGIFGTDEASARLAYLNNANQVYGYADQELECGLYA